MRTLLVLTLVVFVGVSFAQEELLACSSKVYCNNEILSTVQLSGIFNDSKTFVDMPIKTSVAQVLDAFNNLPIPPSNADLMEFIEENFDAPGSDLLVWQPDDHKPDPSSLKRIVDSELYDWAIELNMLWIELGRRVSQDTIEHPENHSLMPVLNGFFVPGGRFREFYYWDTYWIINGLLACEMLPSTVGVLENFFHFVDSIGFIPNGARVYYTERSQPPMLTQMMKSYYHVQAQSNLDTANNFLERYISLLDQEHQFWMNNRSVNIQGFTLNRYQAHSNVPRPEGYAEDVETATEAGVSNPEGPNQIYVDLASGAESGWDFSSRWFADHETLETVQTSSIIPVDLNSIMYINEITMYEFYSTLALYVTDPTTQQTYQQLASNYLSYAQNRKNAIEALLWNNDIGIWLDFNLQNNTQQPSDFYGSSVVPLWAKLYWDGYTTGTYTAQYIEQAVTQALTNYGVLEYPGGIPTSLINDGQQWDFPNGWAPLQIMAIDGLLLLGETGSQWSAKLASGWLQNNYDGWLASQLMYEKYNVTSTTGLPGNGGEYQVQSGFGWTNGVVLELLLRFCTQSSCINSSGGIQVPVQTERFKK